jgi:hypothetical protein
MFFHPLTRRLAMRRTARIFAGILIACPLAAMAADQPNTPEAQLLAAEDARFHAVLTHDAAALDRAIASDVVYSHMTGRRENKAEVMQSSSRANFSSIEPSERTVRVIGAIGIIRGKIERRLPERTLTDGYLAVYENREGRWQLLEWVSSAPPLQEQAK